MQDGCWREDAAALPGAIANIFQLGRQRVARIGKNAFMQIKSANLPRESREEEPEECLHRWTKNENRKRCSNQMGIGLELIYALAI